MKKLILLSAAILISCQLLMSQMSRLGANEFSTWVKVEYAISDNSVVSVISDVNFGQVAQTRKQSQVPWKITAVAVFAVASEAVGDALYEKGKDEGNQNHIMAGKAFQAASLASHFLYIPIMKNSDTHWIWVVVVETGWRIVGFDPIHNIARRQPIGYIGNTSYWDRAVQAFDPPTGMQLFARGVVATFTISITFDKF